MIENGGHGGTAAAPAALKVFEQYFHTSASITSHAVRLMSIEAVNSKRVEPAHPPRGRGARPRRPPAAARLAAARRTRRVVVYGLWAIDGITMHDAGGSAVPRQAVYASPAACSSSPRSSSTPTVYQSLARPIYFGTLGVMIFVLVAGAATRGSRRWIDVGFFTFQPSEFGKVVFVLALAGFSSSARRCPVLGRRLRSSGTALVPIVLVFLQPDIGTALVYAAALAAVLFIAGVRWSHLACWRR